MRFIALALAAALCSCASSASSSSASLMAQGGNAVKYARFEAGGTVSYGIVEGDRVRAITGDLFGKREKTEKTYALSEVKLLAPVQPGKVLALAGNFKSHMGGKPLFKNPELFFKLPTSIVGPGADVVIPPGTENVHYEAELVIVVGKRSKNVSVDEAKNSIFGVTCGNDISARDWQKGDLQWWRAKGCDTFGPIGPYVVTGLNYDDLLIRLRQNGEEKQNERSRDLLFNCATIVSFVSTHVTLEPGDVIFTGTPQTTQPIKPGDVLEVEIEGVGILKNKVAATK